MFHLNPNTIFLTTYKNRSLRRTILPYLDLYQMKSRLIPLSSFLHSNHLQSNNNNFIRIKIQQSNGSNQEINDYLQNLPLFDDIFLIEITMK